MRGPVRIIARTGTTPNQLTALRLLTGLSAAGAFAAGTAGWLKIGAAVFLLSVLLDRADGELARQTGQISLTGYRLDLVADCIASVAIFCGLGFGLVGDHGDAAWLGIVAGIGIGLLFAELNLWDLASVHGHEIAPGVTVDPDDAMLLVPIMIWCGLAWPMLVAAACVTPFAAIAVAVIGLRSRR